MVVGLMSVLTISCIISLKNIKITIYTYCYNYGVLWNKQRRVWMTDWPIGYPHISTQHNRRDQKGLVMIKHPVTKNSAKEEPQNYIKYFPHFQESCVLLNI